MQPKRLLLIGTGTIAVAVGLALAASAVAAPATAHGTGKLTQRLDISIVKAGPTGSGERVELRNFAIEPGVPVTITFTNHTGQFHTFTATGLGLSAIVPPSSANKPGKTTITFTAHAFGVFDWRCVLCPSHRDAMPMGGKIYAIVAV
jgi:plastocyanin